MGFMNPYVGLKRDDAGYYLDYAEASTSPYYKNNQGRGAALSAASQGGRVDMSSFDPFAYDASVVTGAAGNSVPGEGLGPDMSSGFGTTTSRTLTENRYKGQSYGRADQQYATDKEVARIAQEGRDQTKQAQLASEIGYAQDATRRASMDQQQSGTTPGGPDVRLTTGGDNGDALDDEGGGGTRRRRNAYQGSGLKI